MKIFIGWDSREPVAYEVCKFSIERHNKNKNVSLHPLKQQSLRELGLYTRSEDKLASTEFSLTRFLVPYLSNYQGFSIFVDCDFLWTEDVQILFDSADKTKAVNVVKHDYAPSEKEKMDGKIQHIYPRKNWSSMMVFNNQHPSNKHLTPDLINKESPQYLHRFSWLNNDEIGNVSHEWNYLVGWYDDMNKPKAIHYTEGGPWFENYKGCSFANDWLYEYYLMKQSELRMTKS